MHQERTEIAPDIILANEDYASGKRSFSFNRILTNLLIYLSSLVLFYFINKKALIYDQRYLILLPVLIGAWALGGFLSKKFRVTEEHGFIVRVKRSYMSLLISLGTIGIFLLWSDLSASRFVIVGSFLAAFLTELFIDFFRSKELLSVRFDRVKGISYSLMLFDFLILTAFLFIYYELQVSIKNLDENHLILIAATYLSWVSASVIVHQFIPFGKDYNFFQSLAKHLQAYILIIALTSFIVYILQLPENYRSLYLLGLIQYSALSLILFTFIYLKKIPQKTDEIKLKFLQAYELKVPQRIAAQKANGGKYKLKEIDQSGTDLHNKLELTFFRQFPEVFDFIERTIDLSTFNFNKTVVIRSSDPYNLLVLPKSSIQLFTNLHDLNDIRRLNKYFIDINERLITGGIFAGNFEPIRYRFRRFLHRYPFLVAHFLYLLDFIWHRMMPKLPLIRRVFFALSKGKNRALSLAEGLGRLYFCGFEVLDLKDIDNKVYFVARKVSEPLMDSNPSYSPIFKMRRNGKDGKSIFVYKLRTMHPYSEYLQEFVYEHNKLEEGGKFKDDFRITTWGRLFRRLWLDELPMLINWIKGDCKLVGIRPLSNQYLSLYDEDFKTRRFKYKPGLIPPYYADMPKNISEIIKSEEKYLDEYDKSGRLADFKYMLKALKNIVIHKQRSN